MIKTYITKIIIYVHLILSCNCCSVSKESYRKIETGIEMNELNLKLIVKGEEIPFSRINVNKIQIDCNANSSTEIYYDIEYGNKIFRINKD